MKRLRYVLALFGGDLAQLPSQLQAMLQAGYLETEFEAYLEPLNAYASQSDHITFTEYEEHRGVTITKTRPGLKGPIQLVTDPAAASTGGGGLDNGVTPTEVSIEQYTLAPGTYQDGINLDLIGTNFAIVDRFTHDVKTNVTQAIQSLDLLARNSLLAAYLAGRTEVLTASTSLTTTPSNVDVSDIRGFSTVIANGVVTPVGASPNNQLATVYPAGSATGSYQVSITAATADASNVTTLQFVGSPFSAGTPANCSRNQGISGVLAIATISGSKTLSAGDILVAGDAAFQFLPNAKVHWTKLVPTDSLTQDSILDAKAFLEDQGVPPLSDGTFLMIGSNQSFRSLFSDANFQQAWRGLGESPVYSRGRVDKYLGVTFLPTTNAPRVAITGGYAHFPMLVGKGALIDGSYAGINDWADNQYNDAFISLNKGLAQIISRPVDRHRRQLKLGWLTIRDIVAPTDVTASSAVILTSGGSRLKRAVVLPHGRTI